jgi:hypothetical protein
MDPTSSPSKEPTKDPTSSPTDGPTVSPTGSPSNLPTEAPDCPPTASPAESPTDNPNPAPVNRRLISTAIPSIRDRRARHPDPFHEEEDHFCLSEDYPCGEKGDKVHVCHYSSRDGYKTFCATEADSDAARFYPKDYCGPCLGGFASV